MTTKTNRYLILAAAAALSLTLGACGGGDDDATGDATEPMAGDETSAAEETTATEMTDEPAGDAAGAACLIGDWEVTPEAAEAQVLAAFGGEGEVSVEGTSTISFSDTTYTATADNSSTFSVDVQGTPIEGSSATDGTFVVAYTADDTTVTFGEVESAEGAVTTTVAGAETTTDLADTAGALTGIAQSYVCTADTLTVTTGAAEMSVELTYTRK